MLIYPNINPTAFHLGSLQVHWYGLMYLFSFLVGWLLMLYRAKHLSLSFTKDQISDLLFFIAIGVIFGGRLGYMLFYDFFDFVHHPWVIIQVWNGGMSFHGGLIGTILMIWWWAKRNHKHIIDITDFIAPIVPIGLGAGRIGNFINGELWGSVTTMSWGVIFPQADSLPRHPSLVYEFLLEGVLLFIILWWFSSKPRPRWAVSGLFLLLYGSFRIFCEFFRQPDPQFGFIAFGWVTMGELLSIPMIILGVIILTYAYCRHIKS